MRFFLICAGIGLAAFLVAKPAQQKTPADLAAVLKRPLITGASVSADVGTASPGKQLARRFTTEEQIKTIAFSGRPGVETIQSITPDILVDRTMIIAIDFFFWDSVQLGSRSSQEAIEKLVEMAEEKDLPIVLGEIPELLPGRQLSRQALNEKLRDTCESYPRCYLMPFIELHERVLRDGYLEINGKNRTMKELVPDGLHLADETGEYLADVMENLLTRKQ